MGRGEVQQDNIRWFEGKLEKERKRKGKTDSISMFNSWLDTPMHSEFEADDFFDCVAFEKDFTSQIYVTNGMEWEEVFQKEKKQQEISNVMRGYVIIMDWLN